MHKNLKYILFSYFIQNLLCNNEYVTRRADFDLENDGIEDLVNKLRNYSNFEWFANQTASWNTFYQAEFVEFLTKRGFGFTFNMLEPSKLFTDE
jgi:hypothetical protein